jgi:membrane-bound metal-dependent hydrolase YbcI (DUF457 family)
MDNLAHALVGAAVGRAIADRRIPAPALVGMVAANAPDWAELFYGLPWWSQDEYLRLHRGLTHSLAAALVETAAIVLLIGAGIFLWRRRRAAMPAAVPWGPLTLCVAVAVLSHLYMDWQGSYGLRPFLPWDGTWYYADWVAVVDPFFWLVPLVVLAWGANRHWLPLGGVLAAGGVISAMMIWRRDIVASWVMALYAALCLVAAWGWIRFWFGPALRRRAAGLGLALLTLYAGAQAVAAERYKREVRATAQGRFGASAQWAALTELGHPFTWEPVYASRDTVASDDWRTARHLDDPLVQRALRETAEGRAMAIFARFLAAAVDSSGTVFLRDARYARAWNDGWAMLRVRMD